MFCGFPAVASGREILHVRAAICPPRRAPSTDVIAHRVSPPLSLGQLLALVAVAWVAGALPLAFLGTPDKAGEFGDTFGAINALFSGLAFAGVVYAILSLIHI